MSAIMFFAAGLPVAVAVAGLVGSRRSDGIGLESASRSAADERGITLQTLIITAVVVLLAVAVGVIIIAVTTSSSDDLEETAPEVPGHCTSVEIYDPEVASRNEKGINIAETYRYGARTPEEGAYNGPRISDISQAPLLDGYKFYEFEGSDIGCIPVCIWRDGLHSETLRPNGFLEPGEVVFARDMHEMDILIRRSAMFAAERAPYTPWNNYVLAEGSTKEEITAYGFLGTADATVEDDPSDKLIPYAVHLDDRVVKRTVNEHGNHNASEVIGGVYRVAVAPNQKECLTYDEYGNVLFADS